MTWSSWQSGGSVQRVSFLEPCTMEIYGFRVAKRRLLSLLGSTCLNLASILCVGVAKVCTCWCVHAHVSACIQLKVMVPPTVLGILWGLSKACKNPRLATFLHAPETTHAYACAAAWLCVRCLFLPCALDCFWQSFRLEMEYQLEDGAEWILNPACSELGYMMVNVMCACPRT